MSRATSFSDLSRWKKNDEIEKAMLMLQVQKYDPFGM